MSADEEARWRQAREDLDRARRQGLAIKSIGALPMAVFKFSDFPGQRPVPVKKAGPAAPFPVEPAASLNPNPKE